jgi:7,8-dihydroneopterin aldolase/epimerase/oxygenase
MPDRILLQGIQFYGYHGVYEEERRLGQRFLVDVELRLDLSGAASEDDVSAGVDYSQVYAVVLEIGTRHQFKLLETLATRIASAVLERFPIEGVTVRVTKPAPPLPGVLAGVGVEVTRP